MFIAIWEQKKLDLKTSNSDSLNIFKMNLKIEFDLVEMLFLIFIFHMESNS